MPLFVWALVGCAVLGIGYLAYRTLQARRLELTFTCASGPVPELLLTFFPDQLAFTAPSPPPPFGQLRVGVSQTAVVGAELVPDRAVMRYEGPGIGTGFTFVELGRPLPPIVLREPRVLRGRIGEPQGLWCFGWRCAGFVPVRDAEVVAMGGGEHGIPLATARSDTEGRFELVGLDAGLVNVGLRVRAKGFAIVQSSVAFGDVTGDASPIVPMLRTTALHGRVEAPAGVDPSTLRVLARGLPGVEAAPAPTGEFVLDHVSPDTEPQLLLYGLGPGFAQVPARAVRSAPLRIEVVVAATVRGRVLDAATQVAMGGVLVFCGDAPGVRADAGGYFELTRILPGDVEIVAQWESSNRRKRQIVRTGSRQVQLAPGQVLDDFIVNIQ